MDPPVGSKRRSPSPHSDELDNEPLIPLMGGRRDSPSPERSDDGSEVSAASTALGLAPAVGGAGTWPRARKRRTTQPDRTPIWDMTFGFDAAEPTTSPPDTTAATTEDLPSPSSTIPRAFSVGQRLSELGLGPHALGDEPVLGAHEIFERLGDADAEASHASLLAAAPSGATPMDPDELLRMLSPPGEAAAFDSGFKPGMGSYDDEIDWNRLAAAPAAAPGLHEGQAGIVLLPQNLVSPAARAPFGAMPTVTGVPVVAKAATGGLPPSAGVPLAAAAAEGGGGGGAKAERKEWSTAEDDTIRNGVALHGCKWRKIAAMLPGRSDDAVRNRWNRLKNEDAAAAAAEGGEVSAPPPPKPAAPRKPKAEKEEGGGAKPERVSWSRAEDATIVHSVAELGHKWYLIAQRLPGRTDHAIRNRYHRLQAMSEDQQILRQNYAAQHGLTFDGAPPAPPVGDPNLSAVLGPVPEILA